ncbi:unnamed protein product [Rangifer tarandus platyrhynchus]|uniref:Uncharacterized protein n=1 Tax=Rangifer tarandus platyrhynchus TaxID=3082113 RepID=A0ABN8ZUD6_RANTA|nr:unnamed protein product [Rangifer tarandus platyrhynchus]
MQKPSPSHLKKSRRFQAARCLFHPIDRGLGSTPPKRKTETINCPHLESLRVPLEAFLMRRTLQKTSRYYLSGRDPAYRFCRVGGEYRHLRGGISKPWEGHSFRHIPSVPERG